VVQTPPETDGDGTNPPVDGASRERSLRRKSVIRGGAWRWHVVEREAG